jgi:hypothetical protein
VKITKTLLYRRILKTMTKSQFNHSVVLSAIKGSKFAPEGLKGGKLKVYDGWQDEKYVRGRATFITDDNTTISYFLHISPQMLKIWEDKSNNPSPNYTLDGDYVDK